MEHTEPNVISENSDTNEVLETKDQAMKSSDVNNSGQLVKAEPEIISTNNVMTDVFALE